MQLILRILTARVSNKIVLPYLLLALCIAIAMTFVTVRLTAGALQDRLNNRLIEAGQVTSDSLVAVEDQQIEQLRSMVFTEGVADAFARGDSAQITRLLRPYWASARLYTLVAFDASGKPLLAWQRDDAMPVDAAPQELHPQDLASWWIVQQIVSGHRDVYGDKFSTFHDTRLYTAAPVRRDGRQVGGLMVGLPLDLLLERLESRSQASITTLYDDKGRAFATTQVIVSGAVVPATPADVQEQLASLRGAPDSAHIQSVVALNGRDYQFAYSPLRIRRAINGSFSVALSRGFILDAWANQRLGLVVLALLMLWAAVGLGLVVSRYITRPLQDLVLTAHAVAGGELRRRSGVSSRDELGVLARSFNQMTERLLHLYETSRKLSAYAELDTILAQIGVAVQPLAPGASVLALLEDHDGWGCYVAEGADEALRALHHRRIADSLPVLTLSKRAERPVVAPADAHRLRFLQLPRGFAEVCYITLKVQERLSGMLLLIHPQRGGFVPSAMEPLLAVANMAATSLHNTRLYLEVQQEGERRRAILESIADGVLVCDAEQRVVLMNPAAEALLETRDWVRRRYRFEDLPLAPLADGPLLAGDGQIQPRYESHGRVLRASSAALPAPDQASAGKVIVLHNISEEVALDQAKTDLIAVISHELRTPLTSIQGAVDMLCKGIGGELLPLQQELASTALRQARSMSVLVEKAIMVANIEAGQLDFDIHPTQVRSVVDLALGSLREIAAAAGVELRVTIPEDLPPVLVDARMLKLALEQVIDNAIKYGGEAPVRITARRYNNGVMLAVRDHGPGIPAEDLPHLFRRLGRGADSANAETRGVGLGLVITRELIERQGGSIGVQSQVGQGSLFTIFLPGASDAAQSCVA